jgi:hypothetical protein
LRRDIQPNDTRHNAVQHNDAQLIQHASTDHVPFSEWRIFIVVLSVIMPIVVRLNGVAPMLFP